MDVKRKGNKLVVTMDIEEVKSRIDSDSKHMFKIPEINSIFFAHGGDTKAIEKYSKRMLESVIRKGNEGI